MLSEALKRNSSLTQLNLCGEKKMGEKNEEKKNES